MRMPDERTGPNAGVRIANRRLLVALRPTAVVVAQSLLVVLAMGLLPAGAQEVAPAEAEAIGHDGYIYGFPILENYRRMHAAAIDRSGENYVGPLNRIVHQAELEESDSVEEVTPDLDTRSSQVWMDLRREPVVLSIPAIEEDRYYSIQLVDLYNFNFAYISPRTTKTSAGHYLIAGPRWSGQVPEGISGEIRSETEFVSAHYRTQLKGPEDLERLQEIQAQYRIQPLSDFLREPPPDPIEALLFPDPVPVEQPDLASFELLDFLLSFCPPHPSDEEIRDRLERIGVAGGRSEAARRFNPASLSEELREALQRGIEAGAEAVAAAALALKVRESTGSRSLLEDDYLKRAAGATYGRYNDSIEEALHQLYLTDAERTPLDASKKSYVLRISEDELPPVHAFWSITLYDAQTKTIVPNPLNRHRISSSMLPGLARNSDGGVTIAIQPEPPVDEDAVTWLPAPEGPFYIVLRLYWPRPEAYDGTWTPPLIWPAETPSPLPVPTPAGAEAAEEVQPTVIAEEPKPELERPAIWEEPTEVQIAIYVIDVDEVNSASQSFSGSVFFEARWKNPFLRHKGPDPIHRELTDVWNPRLTIVGQQTAWRSYPESVEIRPDGTVVYRQKMWGRFSQPLKLRDFPFDRQQLSLHVIAAGLMEKEVQLVPLKSESRRASDIAASFSLPDFRVTSWNAAPAIYYPGRGEASAAGFEMKINVARSPIYYVLKIIIPLCLIVVMSWLPRWMDPEQSGTNIGISTSAFLTLVAYLFAIAVLLPRVSYVTRMDRFILLSMLMVFGGLIQTVANTVWIRSGRKELARRFDRGSRGLYPLLLALVLVVSFVLL